MHKIIWLILVFAMFSAWSQDDKYNQEAQQKTQDLLRDKTARDAFIKTDKKAQGAQNSLNMLTGDPQTQQQIFELAADLMPKLVEMSGGDVSKMTEIITKAGENPASFANQFTPEQRERLRQLSLKIQSTKAP